ncbi:DgyrCDS6302 [Dimorphilus gyrociliatus]|uniref:DgyrCDS6302 n=1 Tax=Dimorphilus gyrociliatus TaxID=2664684 RepID=A0A7I8VQG7_9ANNE|nr:DgyrCDS6302 [Dimorphilus gyrociliatus]
MFRREQLHTCLILTVCLALGSSLAGDDDDEIDSNYFRDGDITEDFKHIRKHLEGIIDVNKHDIEKMSVPQVLFHYFKSHDFDDNNRLDGLELMEAMSHSIESTMKLRLGDDFENVKDMQIRRRAIRLVDRILRDDDINGDGYIGYREFAKSTRLNKVLKRL